jgi:hypothetical protein
MEEESKTPRADRLLTAYAEHPADVIADLDQALAKVR